MIRSLFLNRITSLYKSFCIIALIIVPNITYSQSNPNEIEDIVVVGSRINNSKLTKILPITIIDSKDIELLGISNIWNNN